MGTHRISRKTQFRLAIVRAGTSVSEWARQNGVSRTHLYAVLDGERIASDELNAKIDALLIRAKKVA